MDSHIGQQAVALEIEALRNRVATMAAGAILIVGIPVLTSFAITDFQPALAGLAVALFGGLGIGIGLIRSNRGAVGRLVILSVVTLTLLGRATWFGGVNSVPFVGWVVVILLSAVLVRPRAGWFFAGFGVLFGLALYGLELQGALPEPLRPDTSLTSLRIGSALFLIVGLLAWSLTRRIEQGLRRFGDADAERAALIERYELAGQGALFGVWDCDQATSALWRGPGIQQLLGGPAGAVTTSIAAFLERVHPEDRQMAANSLGAPVQRSAPEFAIDYRIRHADGTWLWVQSRGRVVGDGSSGATRCVGSLSNIASTKRLEQELQHRAFHDPLTGLPNRDLFHDRVGQALADARRACVADFAVVFLDLDRFKVVNDTFGHAAGDALLVEVGQRLAATLREPDTVARIGGDEFALLLRGVSDAAALQVVVRRCVAALDAPFPIRGEEVLIQASLGILIATLDYREPEELLADADMAMYAAKSEATVSVRFYEPSLRARVRSLMELDAALRGALDRQEFVPWYQPIVDLRTGELLGVEALARWPQPDGSVRGPGSFIPRAEETGLVAELDKQIIARAMREIGALPDLLLSVNLSARQFRDRGIEDWVLAALASSGLPPHRLQVEVTESVLLVDLPRTRQTFSRLTARGIRVALDDFGTGYSSLSYLHRLDLQVLKIDISFVQELGERGPGPICEAILSVADKLGLDTSAEGIETEAQRQALVALGCTHGQGFLFSEAVPLSGLLGEERAVG